MKEKPSIPSHSLKLTVNGRTTELSLADLAAMPQVTIVAHNGHTNADEHYSGVSLGAILAKDGLPVGQATHQEMLRSYLIAEGTDNYWVLYSVTEIEPSEHKSEVIVATSLEGKPLGADGAIRLIDNGEKKPQRWVRNLRSIVVTSAPE